MRSDYHQPDLDGSEPDDPPYVSAGVPSAELLAGWLADHLEMHKTVTLSSLAQAAINDAETASPGTNLEATLFLLSDYLHRRLEGDDEPTRTNDAEDRYNRGGW